MEWKLKEGFKSDGGGLEVDMVREFRVLISMHALSSTHLPPSLNIFTILHFFATHFHSFHSVNHVSLSQESPSAKRS